MAITIATPQPVSATPIPQPPVGMPASPPATPPPIRDIAPPVDVFPWPPWMVALVAVGALIVLGVIIWLIVRAIRNRPKTPPLTPRQAAIRELEALRPLVQQIDPYEFSVRVSDVLRGFVGGQYGLRAKEQTSPEFLASISSAADFTDDDRGLLTRFLEKCDLIKFAHIDASSEDSAALLSSAVAFVQGARA
jgi:hypothetical protein